MKPLALLALESRRESAGMMIAGLLLAVAPATPVAGQASERGSAAPARRIERVWADFDRDGLADLYVFAGEGRDTYLRNAGDGSFVAAGAEAGLPPSSSIAARADDFDQDGDPDLLLVSSAGAVTLFSNRAGSFELDTALERVGLPEDVAGAEWVDFDQDGKLDLELGTGSGALVLLRNIDGWAFERVELGLPSPSSRVSSAPTGIAASAPTVAAPSEDEERESPTEGDAPRPFDDRLAPSARVPLDVSLVGILPGFEEMLPQGPTMAPLAPSLQCVPSLEDQANPGTCLQASTTPALGRLYPLSTNLFVALGGNVGIGTTSPSAKLDVAGTARVTDTLTLAPSGDQALDVSTGSIYKGGALFIHTKGSALSPENTAIGREALANVTYGVRNTAIGHRALTSTTYGNSNTACGNFALRSNTTGGSNTAIGDWALFYNTTGGGNTACGRAALRFTTSNNNTACGASALSLNTTGLANSAIGTSALFFNTTGHFNAASGAEALRKNTTGSDNMASGYQSLFNNTTGYKNTAVGSRALLSNTTGYRNTACGYRALANSTATGNIALGFGAGQFLTNGNDNIAIGHYGVAGEQTTIRLGSPGSHFRTFIAGIRGATTGVANAIPVLVDSAGQLGTISSSARFKEEIRDMGELTKRLLQLRPVVFRYKPEVQEGERPLEYGLIAEEVAEVFPELVVHDEEGKPFTVKYHLLSSMLLNEVAKLHDRLETQGVAHERELEELRGEVMLLRAHDARLAALEDQVFGGESSPSNRRKP